MDVFGQVFLDQARTEQDVYYFTERDDNLIEFRSAKTYFRSSESWSREERTILKEAGERVLDIGCGAGRTASISRNRESESLVLTIPRELSRSASSRE